MHSKILLLSLLLICVQGAGFAQTKDRNYAKSSVYIELGGAAGLWSVNYDRSIWEINERFNLHGRAGVGILSEFNGAGFPDVLIPISSTVLWGGSSHRLEGGGGFTYFNWTLRDVSTTTGFVRKTEILGHLTLGYRYQKIEGGFMFRVTYSPIIYNYSNAPYEHWAGVSVGYTFKTKG
ncbi:MAG: hypothetical protein ACI865_000701 [Flavobacteriaceae bacterium]|jgi:hypothetical protein